MSLASAVINGQLVPVAPGGAINPPSAVQTVFGAGAGPNNLPGGGTAMGGALSAPNSAGGVDTGASIPTVQNTVGNVWALPLWQNPLFFTLLLLVVGYVILRTVHWHG